MSTFSGFVINGQSRNDKSGYSVSSAGDVNGDGLDDVIVGAHGANCGAGKSYVVFGKANGGAVDLSDISKGIGGFAIAGETAWDRSGISVSSAGDVNGDGLADLIVGAKFADANGKKNSGKSYVVFGKDDGNAVALSDIASGEGGFVINGAKKNGYSGGAVSSAGDVNGDGLDDLIVGGANGRRSQDSYVVFGKEDTSSVELSNLASGNNGFTIKRQENWGLSGLSVSSAGDVNGDGLDDVIVSAPRANNSSKFSGKSYVVFGKDNSDTINLSDIANKGVGGFVIKGAGRNHWSGRSVSSAGDVNGDGLDDLIIGASGANVKGGHRVGKSYVVFGKADSSEVDLSAISSGQGGYVINGNTKFARSGVSVSSAGDVNGDGLADLIVGTNRSGKSYVVFGKSSGAAVNLSDVVSGVGGFVIKGESGGDKRFVSVSSAGDVNGDGLDDLIVGAKGADGSGGTDSGKSYVIFGKTDGEAVKLDQLGADSEHSIDYMGDANANTYTGTITSELIAGGTGDDILSGGGGTDVLLGGAGDDTLKINASNLEALNSGFDENAHLLARVNGGTGTDTLELDGSGIALNLTDLTSNRIEGIEIIDLTGSGNNTLQISAADLRDLNGRNIFNDGNGWSGLGASVSYDQLAVKGAVGDLVRLDEEWTSTGTTVSHDGQNYSVYTAKGVQLLVEEGVYVKFGLTSAPDGTHTVSIGESHCASSDAVRASITFGSPLILAPDETLQISADGGLTWVNATASDETGTQWETADDAVTLSEDSGSFTARIVDEEASTEVTLSNSDYTVNPDVPTDTPTVGLTIDGSGATDAWGKNTITFTFDKVVTGFDETDIIVANGTLDAGSLTRTHSRMWTATVTRDGSGAEANVAVDVAAGAAHSVLTGESTVAAANVTTLALETPGKASPYNIGFDFSEWDTSHATSMSWTFSFHNTFNQDIGDWDVSNITDMSHTFYHAENFNQDIGDWDVSNVTTMGNMFLLANAFNQDIGGWDVSNVTNMHWMFSHTNSFNQDIGGWDVSNVTIMENMFFRANAFNQDIGGWNVSNVTDMESMFREANAFNQDVGGWDVCNVTDMGTMFRSANAFNQDIGSWNVNNVTHMGGMFRSANAFNQDIGSWDVSNVTHMAVMFNSANAFNQDIGNWNVSNVTTMYWMFKYATAFNQDLSDWDVSNVMDMTQMFYGTAMSIENIDATLRGWAKIDISAEEIDLRNNVNLGLDGVTYSDATARQYLIDVYSWNINGTLASDVVIGDGTEGNTTADTLGNSSLSSAQTIHGLGGNDTLTGGSANDFIVGGSGDDILTGNGGSDIFDYGFKNAGSDTITDFTTGSGGDTVDISDLLIGYDSATSILSEYITATASGGDTVLSIDYDGARASTSEVTITLENVAYTNTLIEDLINQDNLVLGTISTPDTPTDVPTDTPTVGLTIDGSGATDAWGKNTITFTFDKVVTGFDETDIIVANGTLDAGSLTRTHSRMWTATVTRDGSGAEANVAVDVAAGAAHSVLTGESTVAAANVTTLALETPGKASPYNIGFDFSEWDTSHATSMSWTFSFHNTFNQDIGDWDVSNITDMSHTFYHAENFNQDIGDWDVSNVTTMGNMFLLANAFNQDIGGWDVSNVTNMHWMFSHTNSFNQDIGGWDVSNVTIMENMFFRANAFNQDIGGWNVSNVTDMESMFREANAFNQDVGGWDVCNVTDMGTMFRSANAFNQDIGSWNVNNVTHMGGMFRSANAFNQDIGSWDVSNVTHMAVMFNSANAFNQDIGNWNVSNVTTMYWMFKYATAFNQDLSDWDVSNVMDMTQMFYGTAMSIENIDATLRGWAKIDISAEEIDLRNNVNLGLDGVTYSDATARQYLIDVYSWNINGTLASDVVIGDGTEGNTTADTLGNSSLSSAQTIHGLGGNDTLTGGSANDFIVGGSGDDILTGNGGSDIFDYGFKNAGSDTITDFTTGSGGDTVDISDLLIGYDSATSILSEYITATASGGDTVLSIDYDGARASTSEVTITLENVAYTNTLIEDLINQDNLVL